MTAAGTSIISVRRAPPPCCGWWIAECSSGQCNLSSLPRRDPDKLVSLEEFQDDVRRALGKSFGEFVEAGQSPNEANCRVFRVVVHGASAPTSRHSHAVDLLPCGRSARAPGGLDVRRRAGTHIERFADADKPLVRSLRFVEKKNRSELAKDGTLHRAGIWPFARGTSEYSPLRNKNRRVPRGEGRGGVRLKLPASLRLDASLRDERRSGVLLH